MNCFRVLCLFPFFLVCLVEGQNPYGQDSLPSEDAVTNFQPSLAVVIGILSIMFSLTFILLIYAKFCHRGASLLGDDTQNQGRLVRSASRFSGIDKTVIESLPFFRFSSLKGSKQGLECAVCLSKFEDIEILRLLPKCKHAFHINCIDQWLEKHSSCPLCRHKVSAEDPTIFTYSNSMRFSWNQSELQEDSNVELYVQREEDNHGSSRFSIGSSFRKIEKGTKEEEVLIQEEDDESDDNDKVLHKFNHKIIVSDVFKNRWSSVSSSDLMFLNSEMINSMSSNRFSSLDENNQQFSTTGGVENEKIMQIKEEMERKRLFESKINTISKSNPVPILGLASTSNSKENSIQTSRIMNSTDRRAISEITALSRFSDLGMKNGITESVVVENKEERMRRLWLPIARRTVQWFASRERRSQLPQNTKQTLDLDV